MEYFPNILKGGYIMNKDFSEFLATLDEETMISLADSINESNKDRISNLENLFTNIGIIDIQITLKLLQLYHNWLNN